MLQGTRSRSSDGNLSWTIACTDGAEGLEGMLWDARHDEPRFEFVDLRPIESRLRGERTGLHATRTVEVRCKREDLEIGDVELTDPLGAKWAARLTNWRKTTKAAEAFIKYWLQQEGLRVGDIHEPFSDLVVGDLLVSLVDDDDLS